MSARVFGQITNLNASRGFGFITSENGTGDAFFHMSGCRAFKSLRLYDRVSFALVSSAKGPRAEDVAVAVVAAS
jgi:cold shock protein